jgi:hypothetical protein
MISPDRRRSANNPFDIYIGDYGRRLVTDDEAHTLAANADLLAVARHIRDNCHTNGCYNNYYEEPYNHGYFRGDIWVAIYTYFKDKCNAFKTARPLSYNNTGEYLYQLVLIRLIEEGYLYRISGDNNWYRFALERLTD